jgi:rhamnogalacturonyl hydrolase YesR
MSLLTKFERELVRVESWMRSSGIQNQDESGINFGGVHAWYDLDCKKFAFLYSEITGYAVTWYVGKFVNSGEVEWLNKATEAADWLIDRSLDEENGGVLCRHDGEEWRSLICSFDNGMCLNGLCNIYKHTKEEKYLHAARIIGHNLINNMQKTDGSFFSKFDIESSAANNPGGKWSLISGPFLVKLSIGLLHLAEITNETVFSESAHNLCMWGLKYQTDEGRFMTSPSTEETFLHPHCYAAEGMLVAGSVLKNQEFVDSARKAVEWIASRQLDDGSFPAYYDAGGFSRETSPDMTAQVVRLWYKLPTEVRPQIDPDKAIQSILNLQTVSDIANADGGICAGDAWFVDAPKGALPVQTHVNSWVSMFSSQAIHMHIYGENNPFHLV